MVYYIHTLSFIIIFIFLSSAPFAHAERGVEIKSKDELSHKSGKLGEYRALVIGINNYQDPKIPALKTAVNDAKEFANLLQTRYGFKVTMLLDYQATRQGIMDKMRHLAASALPDESVLIYYAGHGDVDRVLNDGWWVPADATGGNPATYLDNNYVQRVMRGMKARHVLLVSDSCYSGTLFGEGRYLPSIIDDRYYLNLYNEKSRWGMTSGNKTPVSDSGSEGHSIFAYQLIKALKKNENPYVTTQEICSKIAPIVANNSEQQPLCRPVRDTGDQGGGFVFVSSTSSTTSTTDDPFSLKKYNPKPISEELIRQKDALEREKLELERKRQDLERMGALQAEQKKLEAERVRLADEKKKQQLELELERKRQESERIAALQADQRKLEAERVRLADERKQQQAELERKRQESERIETLQAERKKLEAERSRLADEKKQLAMVTPLPLSKSVREIGRDGRFIAYDNGTVLDTGSGLMWAAKDNGKDVEDYGAKKYCNNYRGGGYTDWRMPKHSELMKLFDSCLLYTSPSPRD